jgi:hypothetical protein
MAAPFTNKVTVTANGLWTLLGLPAAGKHMYVKFANPTSSVDFAHGIEWGLATAGADLLGLPGTKHSIKDGLLFIMAPGVSVWARLIGGTAGAAVDVIVTITQ